MNPEEQGEMGGVPMSQNGQPQQQQSPLANMSQEEIMQLVQEIIKLLQSGVSPEELQQKGVPAELIQYAMQQMQQSQQAPAPQQQPTSSFAG